MAAQRPQPRKYRECAEGTDHAVGDRQAGTRPDTAMRGLVEQAREAGWHGVVGAEQCLALARAGRSQCVKRCHRLSPGYGMVRRCARRRESAMSRVLRFLLLPVLIVAVGGAARAEETINLPTRPGVTQSILFTGVAHPAASLILFPGNFGLIRAVRGNFLIR